KNAPFQIVQSLTEEEDYSVALTLLHKEYGNQREKRLRLRKKITALDMVAERDADGMVAFSYGVRGLLAAISKDPLASVEQVLDELGKKLPYSEQLNWQRYLNEAFRAGVDLTFDMFTDFV